MPASHPDRSLSSDANLTVADHPLIRHKLSLMRRRSTSTKEFRTLLREITTLLLFEMTRDLPLRKESVTTPLEIFDGDILDGKKPCFVTILRAGDGLLQGALDLIPSARVGHVGLYRDPKTLQAVDYYLKLPADLGMRRTIMLDPMLATGNSAAAAVDHVKKAGASDILFLCLLAAPEGIERFSSAHPDVPVFTAALDRCLDEHGYIRPGLGDAGDRLFGTK